MMKYRAVSLFKEATERMSLNRQFEKISLLFHGATYKMGSENMEYCDCSGLICGTLNLMGYKIRVTADEIMKKLTNVVSPEGAADALMFVGCQKKGKYGHIGIGLTTGEDIVVYNASYPTGVQSESINTFISRYEKRGYTVDYSYLNWDKVKKMDGVAYGLDKELV